MYILQKIFIFIAGSCVGSFLNVCILRLPKSESVIVPRSYCPHCKKQILWYDNIPLLSYLLLKGKCRFCREKISFRYFLVELITALSFLLTFLYFDLGFKFFFYSILFSFLITASFIDIDLRIIPDSVSVTGMLMGLALSFFYSIYRIQDFPNLVIFDSFHGAIAGAGVCFLTAVIFNFFFFVILDNFYKRVLKKEFYLKKEFSPDEEPTVIGGGDVYLMALIGAFLGFRLTLLSFFIAPFLGAVVGLINLLRKRSHLIPYGPFLSLGAMISVFWGDRIISILVGRF